MMPHFLPKYIDENEFHPRQNPLDKTAPRLIHDDKTKSGQECFSIDMHNVPDC